MDKPTLMFIHIPKTGGSTLGIVLNRQFPSRVLWRFKPHQREALVAKFKALPVQERQKYRILKGHIPYGMHEWTGRPTTYITFLRDPVEHIGSVFYYARRRQTSGAYDEMVETNMDLEDFVRGNLMDSWENIQTRLICGSAIPDAWDYDKPVTRPMLDAAKANIERDFACIGLTERFDESLLMMQRIFGWKNIYYVRQRVSKGRPRGSDIPAGAVEAIRERTALDAELYAFAKEHFERQLAALGGVSAEELARFREGNRRFGVYWSVAQEPWLALLKRGRKFRDHYLPGLRRRQAL